MSETSPIPLRDGYLLLDESAVERADARLTLSARERAILAILVAADGATCSRDTLASQAGVPSERAVDYAIRRLRVKIEVDPAGPVHLLTVHGQGYRFAPERAAPQVVRAPSARRVALDDGWVDLDTGEIEREDTSGRLSGKELAVFVQLSEAAPEAVSRQQLALDVWGRRASSAHRYVDYVVHRLRAKLEAEPETPRLVRTVAGTGFALRPVVEAASEARPAERLHNLGGELTPFVARHELDDLGRRRLVTLVGPAGAGKTRLAREYALAQVAAGSVDEAWFCDLTTCGEEQDVVREVARVLGIDSAGDPAVAIAPALDRSELLLILDNAEPHVEIVAAVVHRWSTATTRARFLVTSRERLRARGEHVVSVGPLARPAARELFCDRARDAGARWLADPVELESVEPLVDALDRLPLALEIAAARAPIEPPSRMLARMRDGMDIHESWRGTPERQRSVAAALEWSWATLTEVERSALAQCAAFRGGFDLRAAEAVLEGPGMAIDRVEGLRDKSLLYLVPDAPEPRLDVYRAVLAFIASKAPDEAARRRHATWFSGRASEMVHRWWARHDSAALAWLTAEHANLRTALTHGSGIEPAQALMGLAIPWLRSGDRRALHALAEGTAASDPTSEAQRAWVIAACELDGASTDAGRQWRWAVETARGVDDALFGRSLLGLAWHLARREKRDLDLGEARAAFERCGQPCGTAETWMVEGAYRQNRRELEHAMGPLQRALALYRAEGATEGEMRCLGNLGRLYNQRGEPERAGEALRAALRLARQQGSLRAEASISGKLGTAALQQDRIEDAAELVARALALHTRLGYVLGMAQYLGLTSMVHLDRSAWSEAEAASRRSFHASERAGFHRGMANDRALLGIALLARRRFDEASDALLEAQDRFAAADMQASSRRSAVLRAIALAGRGDGRGAEALLIEQEGHIESELYAVAHAWVVQLVDGTGTLPPPSPHPSPARTMARWVRKAFAASGGRRGA